MQNKRVAALWAAGIEAKAEHFKSERVERIGRIEPLLESHVIAIRDLYSYRMLIGRCWRVLGPKGDAFVVYWINGEKVSRTTTRHQSLARQAMSVSTPYVSDGVGSNPTLLGVLNALNERADHAWPHDWIAPLIDWLVELSEQAKIREQEALDLANNGEMLHE